MSIKSTKRIERRQAIERIKKICSIVAEKNYKKLETTSFEPDKSIQTFIDSSKIIDISNIENWTNKMLEDTMDLPFFRQSIFDNYYIF